MYKHKEKSVLVFGSYHTNNTADKEITQVEQRLEDYKPDIILYEGDYIDIGNTKDESVQLYFEMGLARWWAKQHGIPDMNIEPVAAEKNKYLLSKYSTDKIILATILGQNIAFITQHNKADFEKLYPMLVADLEREGVKLNQQQKTLAYFYKEYKAFYKQDFDPGTFDYETVEIKFNKTELNIINQDAAAFRDKFMLQKIREVLKTHNKVYVQVGGRHALVWQNEMKQIIRE